MTILEIIASILLFVFSVLLIIVVLSQQGKDAYLGGAIAGGAAETFLGKNKASSIDKTLTNITRVLAVLVVVLTLFVNITALFK